MMIEKLTKVEDALFQEKYEGERNNKRVVCILDDNCVRYIGFVNGKRVVRREYANGRQGLCVARAIGWLYK